MNVAVFDNPATMCREAWRDGLLVAHISAELIYTKGFEGFQKMHFALNCGKEFERGKVRGDVEAIAQEYRPTKLDEAG